MVTSRLAVKRQGGGQMILKEWIVFSLMGVGHEGDILERSGMRTEGVKGGEC